MLDVRTEHRSVGQRHFGEGLVSGAQPPLNDDVWELYDTTKDWSQAHDLAKKMPDKLAELKRLFDLEASKYNVFPLDDRKAERANPDIAGRPAPSCAARRSCSSRACAGSRRTRSSIPRTSRTRSPRRSRCRRPARRVIVAQGGGMGGWSLYVHEGKLKYHYNFLGIQHFEATAAAPLPAGKHQARMEFTYDGGGIGKGAAVALHVSRVVEGRVRRTHALFFSMDEMLEVGCDMGDPVSEDYGPRANAFNGKVNWVQIDIDATAADADHLIAPEERFRLAMARQ